MRSKEWASIAQPSAVVITTLNLSGSERFNTILTIMESKPDRRYRHGFEPRWSARMDFDYSALRHLVTGRHIARPWCSVYAMTRRRTWTDEKLVEAVASSLSIAGVLRALGLSPTGANYKSMYVHIERLGLSIEHFTGAAWNVGENYRPFAPRRTDKEVFVKNSTYLSGDAIKKRLLALGTPYCCSRCGITDWNDEPLSLHLEHKNGDHRDNRKKNLCLLCPNCHSQTKTYCGRNKTKRV